MAYKWSIVFIYILLSMYILDDKQQDTKIYRIYLIENKKIMYSVKMVQMQVESVFCLNFLTLC